MLVQVYLSFFTLAKIIKLSKKVDKKTFDSIIRPVDDMGCVIEQVSSIKEWSLQSLLPVEGR